MAHGADPSWIGTPALPARPAPGHPRPYDVSRTWFRDEADFPGPRTMATAARWLREEARHRDRFLLVVDEFDPHEPFDTPEPYASRYDPHWEGPHLIWPPYAVDGVARGVLTEREGRQLRATYGAKLTMIDHWVGDSPGAAATERQAIELLRAALDEVEAPDDQYRPLGIA